MPKHCLYYWLIATFLIVFCPDSFSQDKREIDSITTQLRKAEKAGNDTLIATELSALGVKYMINDPDLALKFAQRSLSVSQKAGYKYGIANSYNIIGGVYDYKGDYDKALEYSLKSLSLFKGMGKNINIVDVNNSIGIIYLNKCIFSEALKYSLDALNIALKEKDDAGAISSYNNIGLVYETQNEYDKALDCYLKCIKIQRELGKGTFIQTTLLNAGNIYRTKKLPDIALSYYREGLKHAFAEFDNPSIARNYSCMGDAYADKKEWDKALEYHNKALGIRKDMDDSYGLQYSYLALGDIYYKTGNNATALDNTLKAMTLVKRTGEIDYQARIYGQLADIYEGMGDTRLALQNHKLFKKFNDSIFNVENSKKLTEQQMNFDFKLKEEKKEAETKQALQNQKNIRNYSIGILCFIGLLVFIMIRQKHKLATIKRQKAHEAEIAIKDMETQALKVENENITLKEEKLKETLDFNQRELASATMYLYQKNEMLSGLQKEIDEATPSIPAKSAAKIKETIKNNQYLDADWDKFRIHFEKVHPDFFKNLIEKHPTLTSYEVRLAAYFHIQLSAKEIAALLNISHLSVHKAKSRLNKKLTGSEEK